ncbi:dihydrofolate reductase family protein [Microbacterium sp. ET2]|uniref:dihydrofolate reductase family protein n=1 Tax=Microbacterium albipurpureum TaxID=3050384 RepID=UPI00259CB16A|nr:dihydrofolate reductase family protein [Microbacterium sp. ET2 (Ac-2212)]WJL94906.1 dihydrofolate reductase family protein [Microbacterium sp. ET2 (Ac-2212)]
MSLVFIHATLTLDGFLAGPGGEVDWMFDVPSAPEDQEVVDRVCANIGAVVGGANKTRTIEDDEIPYGGMVKAPVFLMTHTPAEPVERDGIIYTFVVDDIATAVESAKLAAGERWVSLLGGSIARQCLRLGLVDEIHLDITPVLLGEGISLFGGLGMRVDLERLETSAFASETHLRFRVRRGKGAPS